MLPLPRLPAVAALDSALFIGTNWVDLTDGGATTLHKHDHGGQDGLADDDHAGYFRSAGRSGGQSEIGGLDAGDDLTLSSTAHATKGNINLGAASTFDEVNTRLGVGTLSPLAALHLVRDAAGGFTAVTDEVAIFQRNPSTSSNSVLTIISGTGTSSTAGSSQIRFGDADLSYEGYINYNNYENKMAFATNHVANRLVIDNAGKVGINNASPAEILDIGGNGIFTGFVKSSGALGIGYAAGAGGAVTQITSKATGVTLNKICGTITLHAANLAAGAIATFIVTNSTVAATDVIYAQHDSAGTLGAYTILPNTPGAGSFQISVRNNTGGDLGEAIVIRFVVIKAVVT